MKARHLWMGALVAVAMAALAALGGTLPTAAATAQAQDPCLACHTNVTPGIVEGWKRSKHSRMGVSCQVCHTAMEGDPSAFAHNGFTITAVVSPNYCARCHQEEVEQNARSKHAFAAVNGPLKLYYKAAKEQGLDPYAQETAKQLDPQEIARRALTPLFPDSGILQKIGLLDDPDYNHENATMTGCMQCHGTFVIADGGELKGWPNNGIGRVNPDGSLGSCAACHTRHTFSVAEARKPETCGQCHLGPDHPQMEIYLESKHGNIYQAQGEGWNWEAEDWGPDDILAPTCATCHMSGFGGAVETTHDVGSRLKWEIQAKDVMFQSRESNLAEYGFVPDEQLARENRERMLAVCTQCHSRDWAEGYLAGFERTLSDYQKVWDYTKGLLQQAYDEGLISRDNPIDEQPEILAYLIWHHDGRRWRMGASMMGPDYTHWHGAVEAIMDKLGAMLDWIETRRVLQELGAVAAELDRPTVASRATVARLSPEAVWDAAGEAQEPAVTTAGVAPLPTPLPMSSWWALAIGLLALVLGSTLFLLRRRRA